MSEMVVSVEKLALDEFIRLYDAQPFELVDGEIRHLSPTLFGHNTLARRAALLFSENVTARELGEAYVETPFAMTDDSKWVTGSRVSDVMFIRLERLNEYKAKHLDWEDKPLLLVPDLVIEIVSPGDKYIDVLDKVKGYLRDGVQIVWVINQKRREVTVYTAGSDQHVTFRGSAKLSGGEVIPGFEVAAADLFG